MNICLQKKIKLIFLFNYLLNPSDRYWIFEILKTDEKFLFYVLPESTYQYKDSKIADTKVGK